MHPRDRIEYRIGALKAAGQWREPAGGRVDATPGDVDARSNDYLGLSRGAVSRETVDRARVGAGASRLISGTCSEHLELERELAGWLGAEAALLFSSGYAANVGALSALAGPGETILSDALNHASIIDGARLSRAEVVVLPHADLVALERALVDTHGVRWVVTETYFGMDGDSPDLRRIRALCDEHRAALVVDEAHALGVFGPEGRGYCAESGVVPDVLIGGMGKAMGAQGGFVACSAIYRDWLWNRARSLMFSTATSPVLSALALAQLRSVRRADPERRRLRELEQRLAGSLAAAGVPTPSGRHGPLFPVVVGSEQAVLDAAARAAELGVRCHPIRPPTVPRGASRLRVSLRADMTESEVDRIGHALARVWEGRSFGGLAANPTDGARPDMTTGAAPRSAPELGSQTVAKGDPSEPAGDSGGWEGRASPADGAEDLDGGSKPNGRGRAEGAEIAGRDGGVPAAAAAERMAASSPVEAGGAAGPGEGARRQGGKQVLGSGVPEPVAPPLEGRGWVRGAEADPVDPRRERIGAALPRERRVVSGDSGTGGGAATAGGGRARWRQLEGTGSGRGRTDDARSGGEVARERASEVRRVESRRWVILGTGTGIGKTFVARGLVEFVSRAGRPVAGVKPIETGLTADGGPSDARRLAEVSFHVKLPARHPLYGFSEPVTPSRAARAVGERIDLSRIAEWLGEISAGPSAAPDLVIETAGGVFSPLTDDESNFDLALSIDPAIWVLVAPNRLGVLHDVVSTLRAMEAGGRLPDWLVLSAPEQPDASTASNRDDLARSRRTPPIIELPRGDATPLAALLGPG